MAVRHDKRAVTTRHAGRLLGAVAAFALSITAPAQAQIARAFTSRFSTNASGTVQIIGNGLMTCPASATCTTAQGGTGGSLDNNGFTMVDIDVDGVATTPNSSQATFTLPAGGSVLFAGLYWGARSNAATRNQVQFRTPALGAYTTITATQLDANNPAYQGFANVTALVQAGGSGTYTVGNVQRTLGTDQYAGWALVIVVKDPAELRRNLVVFDGYGTVQTSAASISIPVSGFLTPTSGAVNSQLGAVAYEGDLGQTGDVLRLNATNLSDAVNPANNVFNSTISRLGSRITSKNPDYVNQLGFDADVINASGILPNGATSATITLTTGGETFYPGVVTIATQLYVPDLSTTFTKTVTDVNGGAVQRGDTLQYEVSFTNTGLDTAVAVVVTDTIPTGTTYVPGSITYVTSVPSGPPTGGKTDASGDDAANFDVGGNRVQARIGIGATPAAGGRLGPAQGSTIRFRVVVNTALATGSLISNQAGIDYTGQTLGDVFNSRSDGDAGTPGIQPTVVTLAANADVQLGKTGPAAGSVGSAVTYTVTATNAGPDPSTSLVLRDTLPASFTFASATGGGTASGNVVTWPAIASLASGASQSFTVTATPTAAGSFTNIGAASAATFDGTPANNNGSAAGSRVTTVIAGAADVGVTKTGPATVNAGAPFAYSVTVTNAGPSPASGVVVTDTLPAGVAFVSATNGGTRVGNVVTWPAIVTLANGASQVYGVNVTAPATGTLLNIAASTATTTDPVPANNNGSAASSRVTTTVVEQADLAVTKTGPATVNAGQPVTYTITATNAGPSAAAAVVVTDTLPSTAAFVSATAGGTLSGNVVTWPVIPSLASGASQVYAVTVTAPATGPLLDIAAGSTTTADPNAANNNGSSAAARVTTAVVPIANLAVTKSGPTTAAAGTSQTYDITVTNAGPSSAVNVAVTDTLPASVTFVSATAGGSATGRVVSWPVIASMAAGASRSFSVSVTMPLTPQVVLNLAAATSATLDPDPTDNNGSAGSSRVSTTVVAQADLQTSKTGPATVNAGQNIVYAVSVTNTGPSPAATVVLTDTLPAGVTFVSATGGATRVGSVVTWPTIASLASGATQSFTVTVTAPATGTLVNLAAASSTTPDPDPTNNDGSAPGSRTTTTVLEQANIAVTKTGPATVNAGATYSYALTLSNAGPSAAANVVVMDTLPSTVTFVSATGGGTLSGNVVSWPSIVSLANGATQAFGVTVTAPGTGPLLNIAAGSTTTADPTPGNNNGSAPAARVTTAVTAQADVQVTKSGPASVTAGQTFSYTVTVTNAGPSPAVAVIPKDSLPAAGTFVSASPSGTAVGRLLTWPTLATLAPGATQVYTVTWTAPANPAVPLTLTNVAFSSSTTADPVPANNINTNPAARVATVVLASADLATTKTGPATVSAGGSVVYTITTANSGPSTATAVVVVDTLPATAVFVSASNGGTLGAGNVVTWPAVATLASGANFARTLTVTAPPTGTLLNVAASSSGTPDPNPANNNGSAPGARVTTVVSSADVVTTKAGPATVNSGASFTYTLTIANAGPGTATGIVVVDTLPATVTFVSATNGGTLGAGNVVTWPVLATLANAANTTRTVTVTAPASGTLLNIAASTSTSTDPTPANNNGSAAGARVTTVVSGADVATTKAGPATVNGGASMTYTLTIRNNGPGTATGIVVVDTLPATVTFVSASNGGTLGAGNVVTWPALATLANAATTTRTVIVTAPASGTLLNIAASTSTSVDGTPANNNGSAAGARVTTVVQVADLVTSKTGPATASGGSNISYTITTQNLGPNTATNVVISDTLPAAATFVSATNGGVLGAGNVVTWPVVATLANAASTARTVTVTTPASGSLLDIAASTSSTTDPNPANNNGSLPAARVTTLVSVADLITTKSGPATAAPGGSITYTITTQNLGPATAPNVVVRDTLPATVTFVSASNAGTLGAGNVVTWPAVATLANGASVVRTVTVTAPASGTLLNISASSSGTTDPDPSNNNGSAPAARVTTAINGVDVVTTKTGPASATVGSSFSYAITVRNAGPTAALLVVVTDTLPTGLTFVSATNGGTLSGNVITWPTIASMANGATQAYGVTVSVPTGGSFTNIVASTAATADPVPGNNNGSLPASRVTTTVVNQADVVTTKSGPATVNAGQAITYSIGVGNVGPSAAANVVVADTLPAGVTFVSATGGGTLSGNVVTWPTIASLGNGANQAFSVTVNAPASGTLTNIIASTSSTPDPAPANNNGSLPASRVVTTVITQADVATTKSGPATAIAGQNFTYAIAVTNSGPSAAASVVVTDTLPAGVAFVSATGGGTVSGSVVSWPAIASLASGASQLYGVTVTAPAAGSITNIVASTSTTADPVPANNNGSQPASRVTTTIIEQADVVITKSGPATVNAGQNYSYAIAVSNVGPSAAASVVVTDTLPAGVTFVGATAGGSVSGNVVTWPVIVSLGSGANQSYGVTVTAPGSGTLLNIAASTSTTADPSPANNNGSLPASRVTTTVIAQADVATTKSGPASVNAGQAFSYTIAVSNTGPSSAANVTVTDTLPAAVTFVSASGGGTVSGNVVRWPAIGSLASGVGQSYTVTVTAPATGTLLNIAASTSTTTDPDPANNDGSLPASRVTTTVVDLADVVTTKSGPATVNAGQSFSYAITVRNNGPSVASGVIVTDTLPTGATFVSATAGGVRSGNVVTWPAIAALGNGASQAYSVTVTAPSNGTLVNIAASTSTTTDPTPANNNGSLPAGRVTTAVVEQADVVTTKSGPATVNAAQSFAYTLTVANAGPSAAAQVIVTDTLPAGVTFVSATAGGTVTGNVVTWPAIASLAGGSSQGYSVTVTAPSSGTLLNIAASTSTTGDPDPANNDGSLPAARVTTGVIAQADVATSKSGPATVNAGQNFNYAVRVSNAGPSAAANVVLTDTLPAGVTFVSATGGGTLGGNVVTWPAVASLASGSSQNFTVTVTAPATGTLTNILASTSSTTDPDPANNDGSAPASRVTTTIVEMADVATSKTGPATAAAAANYSYAITVHNAGPSAATGVVVTDTLPASVTFVSASGGGAVSGNVITWPAIPSLGNGATQAFSVTVTAPPAGSVLNVVASTSTTLDGDPSNNNGSSPAARVTTVIQERADVVTTKSGPATVPAAGSMTYTITTRNVGPSAASGVVVSDTLPATATFVSASNGGVRSGNVVTWPAIASLAAGSAQTYDVAVVAPASGSFTNIIASTSTTPDPLPSNNNGSDPASRVTTSVSELADVATSKTGPARVNAGDLVTYTISAHNLGPSDALAVVVSDPLPAGSTFVTASNGGTLSGNVVRWPAVATLPVGQTQTYTLQVRAPLLGTLSNVVASTASTIDPIPSNNNGSQSAAQVLTTIEPVDLAITKTSLPQFQVGTIGSYTLTVRNVGNAPTVGPITVVDTLAAGLRYSAASGAGWSCGVNGTVVTCSTASSLAAGGSTAIQLQVNVLPAAAPTVNNSVAVATPGDTASGGNNASSIATVVQSQSPLVAEKGASAATAEIGDVVDYTLTVRNQSSQQVPGVVFSDHLPLGFAYQKGTARVNGVAIADPVGSPGPVLTFPVGTLGGNGLATVTYRVLLGSGAPAGDGINRAIAQSTVTGVSSNTAVAEVQVTGGVFSDRGIIAGKIFVDCACDSNRVQGPRDIGIPGVRIMLEDGTSTITDVEGKYNFYGVSPRVHVLKVDRTTLPPNARLAAISSRNAGDGWTRFVDMRNSEFARGDFAEVSHDPSVLAAVIARRSKGEIYSAIPDSMPMVLATDSLAPSTGEVPVESYRPLLGGLASPVSTEGAATPVLRLPQADQPQGLARPTDTHLEMLVPAQGIPADGVTAVPVRIKLVGANGELLTAPASITLETSLGRWQVEDLDPTQPGVQTQIRDGQGQFMLVAAPREGVGEIRATSGAMVQTGQVAFLPVDRPLTAVGVVEGRIDLRSLAKGSLVPATPEDGFEDELKDISVSGDSGLNRAGARAALYLQGKVKGSYLLTLAFDTEKDAGKQYMQDIQPDEFYPVYGDASVKEYGAQSYDRLYVRIDKDRNYFLYGDYQTPSPSQARQLGAYLRSLTGAVQHFENNKVQANAFASLTRITQVVDELPGLGISGPYQLSRPNARINSERIEILTRDRNQTQRVIRIVPLERYTDYTIEPFTGRILLRQPLASLDAQLNPISMRVTYEVDAQDAPQSWVYGGDAQVHVGSFAEVGASAIQDGNPYNARQIYSANVSARIDAHTQFVAEGALTNTDSLGTGTAGRFELRHQQGRFSANAFGTVAASTFSNPSATFGAGQLEAGLRAAYQIDTKSTVRVEGLLSENRLNGGERKGVLVAFNRSLSRIFQAEIGFRWAEETTAPVDSATAVTPGATPNETNAVGLKLTATLPNKRGSASLEFEQDVVNTDQRRGVLGAEYWLFPRLRLYGRYEALSSFAGPYALNGAQDLATTVVGFDLAYFREGQFFSEYRARDAFSGREAEASMGLRNRWRLAPGITLDGSFERVNPINGGDGSEATAITAAVEYTTSPLWKGTLRAEYRNATSGDNFLATLGYARKLSRDWTLLGRGYWNALPQDQLRTHAQLGIAWRETDENKWNGLARIEHGVERLRTGIGTDLSSRQLDIAVAQVNYQPILRLTLSGQYAAKWLRQDDTFLSKTATQFAQLRAIYDLDHNWDIGGQTGMMWSGAFDSRRYGIGGELGRRLINNLRLAAGYNLFGYRDQDLHETDYTLQGGYLRIDFKFDESILPGHQNEQGAP